MVAEVAGQVGFDQLCTLQRLVLSGVGAYILVFSSDLQQVKEIGRGCVDLYKILVWFWDWVWDGGDNHVLWTAEVLFHLYGAHSGGFSYLQCLLERLKEQVEDFCDIDWGMLTTTEKGLKDLTSGGRRTDRGLCESRIDPQDTYALASPTFKGLSMELLPEEIILHIVSCKSPLPQMSRLLTHRSPRSC